MSQSLDKLMYSFVMEDVLKGLFIYVPPGYVACVYDGVTLKSYGDGRFLSSVSLTGQIDTNAHEAYYVIGSEHNGNEANPFKGLIDEVFIFNRPLSSEEIQNIYTQHGGVLSTEKPSIISKIINFFKGIF